MNPVRGCLWGNSASSCVASVLMAVEQPLRSPKDLSLAEWRVIVKVYKARVAERRKHSG